MSIDPKLQYCTCGYSFVPGVFMKILMLLFGEYSWRCPRCHTVLKFRLIHHVVKVEQQEVKGKEVLWGRA